MTRLLLIWLLLITGCARAESAAAPGAVAANASDSGPRKRVVRASLSLEVSRLSEARSALERQLAEVGGFVQSSQGYGVDGEAWSELVVRVPEPKLAAFKGRLAKLGHVTGDRLETDDVTEQHVDLAARLRNLTRTEARLLSLLDTRTGALAEIIEVERELSRVRGEVEQLTAQASALDRQIAFATLTVSLRPAGTQAPDDALAPLRALGRDAGNVITGSAAVLVATFAAIARALLAALPWLPMLALGWLGARRLRRR